jgi:tRNA 5-methylaminomethyl-2-thiouridine biosynthesis bifunctional protein
MSDSKQTPAWFQYPEYNWQKKHAVVIGAGIAGCQMAWHLSQQGWQVTLIERHQQIASEASGNPAGVISSKMTAKPSPGEEFYIESFNYTLKLLEQLQNQGNGLDWHQCGLLQLAHNQRELKRWLALKDRDFPVEFLQLLNQESASKTANIPLNYKASYFPKAGWINPASFCRALSDTANCRKLLVKEVVSLNKQQNNWHVLDSNGNSISHAEVVIIANGKDLRQFSQSENLPAMPVAGQTTSAQVSDFSKQLKTVIGHEGYLTPASESTGRHTFGASFERDQSKPILNKRSDKDNFIQLHQYLPELSDSFTDIQSAHAAVRMTTPDRFPYAGAIPDSEFYQENYHDLHQGKKWKHYPNAQYQAGLFVLGGFGSRGLTTSGLCARILTNILNNTPLPENNSKFSQYCHPARFIIKSLKQAS